MGLSQPTPDPQNVCESPSFEVIDRIKGKVKRVGGRVLSGLHTDRTTIFTFTEKVGWLNKEVEKRKEVDLAACGHETLVRLPSDGPKKDKGAAVTLCVLCDCMASMPRFAS